MANAIDNEDGGALPSNNAPAIIPDDNDAPQDQGVSSPNNEAPGESSSMVKTAISLGGKRSQTSFALLDGIFSDPESDEKERVTIDITRLPALLGRSNDSDQNNPHFFGLGKKKALSRKHCTIYYRDKEGGHAEWDEAKEALVYKDAKLVAKEKEYSTPKPNPHLVVEDDEGGLPPNGFFVIECLGKNRIVVDRTRVEQGESIVLRSGSAIRISSYQFYFLLPTDAQAKPHTIEVPLTDEEKAKGKRKTKKGSKTASKKRPAPATAASLATKKPKKAGTNASTTTLAELETLPVEELLEKMDEAVSKGLWDRRNQFIGATVCYHAVRSAGMAPPIQEKVLNDGGVSRSDIMEWIENSEKFGGWVQQMLTNMEPRSYQAAITKSLLKSGFSRTSGAGRYIKWELPEDIPLKAKKKKKKPTAQKPKPIKKEEESANSGKEDREDDNGSDAPPEETPKEEEEEDQEEESANDEGGEEEEEAGEGGSDVNEDEDPDSNESGREDTNEEQAAESESDLLV